MTLNQWGHQFSGSVFPGIGTALKRRRTLNDQYVDSRYPLSELTAKALAAAHEVHRVLGPGFEEVIYQRALNSLANYAPRRITCFFRGCSERESVT